MEENYARELLERYVQKKTNETELFKDLAYEEVFCSTYSKEYDHDDLLPVFLTKEDAQDYYEKAGRKDPLIMKKTLFAIINANIGHDHKQFNADKGIIIDPLNYKLAVKPDDLLYVALAILKDKDPFIRSKKTYLMVSICLFVLLACLILSIPLLRSIIGGLNTECRVENAAVINVDTHKNKVTVTAGGKEYLLRGVSDGDIFSYSSAQIYGRHFKVYIADDKAYANYYTLKYDTSIYGTLTNVCYIGAAILLIVSGIVFGSYIEARKREKQFDSVLSETNLIKPDE